MNRRHLLVILVAAAALRLVLLGCAWRRPEGLLKPDSIGYVRLSDNLLEAGRFERDGEPEVFRTPGYPVFLLLSVPFGESWWRVAGLLQIGIDVLLVYLTGMLGWMLFGPRAGLLAAAFQAVCAVAIASSVRILSDGLFAALLTLAVLLVAHHFSTGKWWSLLAAAFVLGAGCYIRPIGQVYACLFLLVLLCRARRIRGPAAFAGIVVGCLLPWIVRNGLRADYWGFSSFASQSMYAYAAPRVMAEAKGIRVSDARGELGRREAARFADQCPTVGQRIRYRARRGAEVLARHPRKALGLHLRSAPVFFFPGATDVLEAAGLTIGERGTIRILQTRGIAAAAGHYFGSNVVAMVLAGPMVLVLAGVYVGAVCCLVSRLRWSMPAVGWLMLLTVMIAAMLGGPANHPRFRVPVAPLLNVAAAAGWLALTGFARRWPGARRAALPRQSPDRIR